MHRWEKCAREGSYLVNSAAGFNRCSSELQERISTSVTFLQSKINKGKAPKEVTETLKDIKDYVTFHQSVSVAIGTALQHLAGSLFVHLPNLILLRWDLYLEHVKPGIKSDTWNLLRNAPMFGHGPFPDSVLSTAEQDIAKHESAGVAPGPGPGASQHSSLRDSGRYRSYEKKRESQQGASQGDQGQQSWCQFSRNRGHGRGRGSNPCFPGHEEINHINDNYHSVPTQLSCQLSRLDPKLSQLNQTVHSLVVNKVVKPRSKQTLRDLVCEKAVSY